LSAIQNSAASLVKPLATGTPPEAPITWAVRSGGSDTSAASHATHHIFLILRLETDHRPTAVWPAKSSWRDG
jgi:hypothetical protein